MLQTRAQGRTPNLPYLDAAARDRTAGSTSSPFVNAAFQRISAECRTPMLDR